MYKKTNLHAEIETLEISVEDGAAFAIGTLYSDHRARTQRDVGRFRTPVDLSKILTVEIEDISSVLKYRDEELPIVIATTEIAIDDLYSDDRHSRDIRLADVLRKFLSNRGVQLDDDEVIELTKIIRS